MQIPDSFRFELEKPAILTISELFVYFVINDAVSILAGKKFTSGLLICLAPRPPATTAKLHLWKNQ